MFKRFFIVTGTCAAHYNFNNLLTFFTSFKVQMTLIMKWRLSSQHVISFLISQLLLLLLHSWYLSSKPSPKKFSRPILLSLGTMYFGASDDFQCWAMEFSLFLLFPFAKNTKGWHVWRAGIKNYPIINKQSGVWCLGITEYQFIRMLPVCHKVIPCSLMMMLLTMMPYFFILPLPCLSSQVSQSKGPSRFASSPL